MDDQNYNQEATNEEKSANKKETEENNHEERIVTIKINDEDAAGPSQLLPGSIRPSSRLIGSARSKSEHSITHIITKQDVANALKLTSLSFATPNNTVKNLNLKDLRMPEDKTDEASKVDLKVKQIVATCLNFSKDNPVTTLPEVPVKVVSVISNEMQELPNSTCGAQTESINLPDNLNEVIITKGTGVIETKVSRAGPDKKKLTDKKNISGLGSSNVDSLSSIGSNVCRICMTRGRERLISPCNCKGSLANVHLSCLERWLNQVGRNHCELCGYSYPAIRTPRYTVVQALRLWFGNPRNRSHLQSDCLIFWLLTTVTAGLLAVCIVGTQYFVIEGSKFGKHESIRKDEGISHRITETAMDFFMAVVLCGYSVTVYLLWKDHYVMWNRWRRANVNVRLLLSPDTSVPFVPNTRYNVV